MDNAKVNAAIEKYSDVVFKAGYRIERHPTEKPLHEDREVAKTQAMRHVGWMCEQALTWGPERLEKKFRWLGFIQGVLWAFGMMPVEEAKRDNMPEGEAYRDKP